jgi:hypothetical protein
LGCWVNEPFFFFPAAALLAGQGLILETVTVILQFQNTPNSGRSHSRPGRAKATEGKPQWNYKLAITMSACDT